MITITIAPTGTGQVTATASDGHARRTTAPLLDGARYWLEKGANPNTPIATVWSSGSTHWSLRSTIGQAAKLTVDSNASGTPVFKRAKKVG
jgi:hypothetical protein